MSHPSRLTKSKDKTLSQLASLGPMRKGSLTEQYVEVTLKDGSNSRRGPYTLYSCKENGKTVSRRLRSDGEVALYREQIAAFRRFQELTAELARIGRTLADLAAEDPEGSKKNSKN